MDPETFKALHIGTFEGLRVYTSKWLPGEGIIMANRPYKDLSGSALSDLLSAQLSRSKPDPIEITAFGDTKRSYLAPSGTTSSTFFDTSSKLWDSKLFSSTTNVETVFRVGADGRPEAVTRLVDKPMATSVRNAGETDLAWLRRRVDEICWVPS